MFKIAGYVLMLIRRKSARMIVAWFKVMNTSKLTCSHVYIFTCLLQPVYVQHCVKC